MHPAKYGFPRSLLVGYPVNKEGPEAPIDVRIAALKLHLASTRMGYKP
jgi:hypothetical protein